MQMTATGRSDVPESILDIRMYVLSVHFRWARHWLLLRNDKFHSFDRQMYTTLGD